MCYECKSYYTQQLQFLCCNRMKFCAAAALKTNKCNEKAQVDKTVFATVFYEFYRASHIYF